MNRKSIITRRLAVEGCHWLDVPIEIGTVMYIFGGCTYGCISPNGTAMTLDPNGTAPFVEIPNNAFALIK
jgi:hypothetical protein